MTKRRRKAQERDERNEMHNGRASLGYCSRPVSKNKAIFKKPKTNAKLGLVLLARG